MEHVNFNVETLALNEPIQIEDNLYRCSAYDGDLTNLFMMLTTDILCRIDDNNMILSTENKEIVKFVNKLYLKVIDCIHNKSSDWFENEVSKADVKQSVKNPILANIENNSLDIICNLSESHNGDDDKEFALSKCTLGFNGVIFDGEHFTLLLEINDFEKKDENNSIEENSNEQITEPVDEPVDELATEQVCDSTSENNNEEEIQEVELPTGVEEVTIDVDDIGDNEEMRMNLEKDNLFMIYDILNEKLRANMYHSVNELFENKKYNISDFDLDDIIFEDSDDEDEDDSDDESVFSE